MSGPTGFKRNTLGFNVDTGEINLENLPPELVVVFKKAGITKKDL